MNKALEQAKDRWKESREAMLEQHSRMREDLHFSNPSEPKQWEASALTLREGRPCLTFDRTNQFISQVVNDARQNKPGIYCMPADSGADIAVAEKLNGIIRHIEYTSRAGIAYDTAIENAARCGMGWLRVVPEIVRPETGEQEIRIKRVHDIFSVSLDPNSTEPDGMDAMWGLIETSLTNRAFERAFPKAKKDTWDSDGWFTTDNVRICEEFVVTETNQNRIITEVDGNRITLSEDEYWKTAQQIGFQPPVAGSFTAKVRKQKWRKLSGCEVLEETEFPSIYVPLVPVYGYEIWIDDKRYVCGMTRRLMDSQKAYNYERSAFIEAVALQPKAPFMASVESMAGHEDDWARANSGNPAYLPFNAYDESGNALPSPSRQNPPAFPVAFAQGGQIASQDMESAIGMFKANLGQSGNETSGRAIMARQREGDTANFHYIDNLSRSIEQLGRIVVDMIPKIYDTPRQARIVGEDGKQEFVSIEPKMPQAVRKEGKKVVAINPGVGTYDVRVKAGPSYTSLRQESAEQLSQMLQGNPALMPILGDVWVRMQDWPEAEKVSQRLKAMLPPELKALEQDDDQDPTQKLMMQSQQMGQQIEQMGQQVEALSGELNQSVDALEQKDKELQAMQMKLNAEINKRMSTELDLERVEALAEIEQAVRAAKDEAAEGDEPQGNAKGRPQQSQAAPVVLVDAQGSIAQTLAPMMQEFIGGLAESVNNTGAAVAILAEGQQALMQEMTSNNATTQALLAEQARPKQSQVRIVKQADGSFVGEKVEA